ncbi:hypothetical protein, partial [Bacillus thuringiensis]
GNNGNNGNDGNSQDPGTCGKDKENDKECSCAKNGYYYELEKILFFELDENGNLVEVWKEVLVKKMCK